MTTGIGIDVHALVFLCALSSRAPDGPPARSSCDVRIILDGMPSAAACPFAWTAYKRPTVRVDCLMAFVASFERQGACGKRCDMCRIDEHQVDSERMLFSW